MHYEGKLRLRSNDVSYCLREVVTKADLTVCCFFANVTESFFVVVEFL